MDSKKTISIVILILIVALIILAIVMGSGSSNTTDKPSEGSENVNAPVENTTDINTLKSSEYTSEGFDKVNIGDSKATVEENMGELTEAGVSKDGYDIFSTVDGETNYFFFFDGDDLKEVTVTLS